MRPSEVCSKNVTYKSLSLYSTFKRRKDGRLTKLQNYMKHVAKNVLEIFFRRYLRFQKTDLQSQTAPRVQFSMS